jgi:hypothetical protein
VVDVVAFGRQRGENRDVGDRRAVVAQTAPARLQYAVGGGAGPNRQKQIRPRP